VQLKTEKKMRAVIKASKYQTVTHKKCSFLIEDFFKKLKFAGVPWRYLFNGIISQHFCEHVPYVDVLNCSNSWEVGPFNNFLE
jgi:hypothetical protein